MRQFFIDLIYPGENERTTDGRRDASLFVRESFLRTTNRYHPGRQSSGVGLPRCVVLRLQKERDVSTAPISENKPPAPCREKSRVAIYSEEPRRFIWNLSFGSRTSKARECLLLPADEADCAHMRSLSIRQNVRFNGIGEKKKGLYVRKTMYAKENVKPRWQKRRRRGKRPSENGRNNNYKTQKLYSRIKKRT